MHPRKSFARTARLEPGHVILAVCLAILGAGCSSEPSFHEVTVVAKDYAFELPDTLPAGPTLFTFLNRGAVKHEMGIGLLAEGLTMQEALEAEQRGEDAVEESLGFIFADPGQGSPSRLVADLKPGRRYGLVCFLRNDSESKPHVQLGMYDSFVVE